VLAETYHGNSSGSGDVDWFHVSTTKINQNLTIDFTGYNPDSDPDDWYISVRDAAGNILARYNSNLEAVAELEPVQHRTFVVTLGNIGTYYVTVEPLTTASDDTDGPFDGYDIAALLSDSGMTEPPPDTNFVDTEIEPNDSQATATELTSNVNMFAYFSKTFEAVGDVGTFDFDSDWFKLSSPGGEELDITLCASEACGFFDPAASMHVSVIGPDGAAILDGPMLPGQTLHFSAVSAGDYAIDFEPQETGEVVEAKDENDNVIAVIPLVFDASGPYNFSLRNTGLPVTNP
jgi:hypothetical protein